MTYPEWKKTFTVTFNRLDNAAASSYKVALGLNGIDTDFANTPAQALLQNSWISGLTMTSFDLIIYIESQANFRYWKVGYLAVSNQFTGIIIA